MPEQTDFVDRIIEAFRSLRNRPHFELIEQEFLSGELTFVVDRAGIHLLVGRQETEAPDLGLG